MTEDNTQLRRIIEGSILAAGEPLSLQKIQYLFGEEEDAPEKEALLRALNEIQAECEGRGFQLVEVASGWRFQVRADVAPWINRLWEEKPQKYSRALIETLALVAYRQPLTRGDIEEVRGVAVSSHIIKTLTEREWVKVVGHRDVPGRPALYATTKSFLDYFNLKSLDEMPTLGELKDIDGLNRALAFEESGVVDSNDEAAAIESEGLPQVEVEESLVSEDDVMTAEEEMAEEETEETLTEEAGSDTDESDTHALSSLDNEDNEDNEDNAASPENGSLDEAVTDDEENTKQPSSESPLND